MNFGDSVLALSRAKVPSVGADLSLTTFTVFVSVVTFLIGFSMHFVGSLGSID